MKFEFEFESLLKLRRHQEKKQQQKLSRLTSQQHQLKKQIATFKNRLKKFGDPVIDSLKASEIRHKYELKQDLQKQIWELQQNKHRLDQAVEQQRKQLLEANKRTQMLEKLKSRQRAQFIENHEHEEQLRQNEIATQMYNRST